MQSPTEQISGLLAGWRDGDRDALDRLLRLIRTELHWLADAWRSRTCARAGCSKCVSSAE